MTTTVKVTFVNRIVTNAGSNLVVGIAVIVYELTDSDTEVLIIDTDHIAYFRIPCLLTYGTDVVCRIP